MILGFGLVNFGPVLLGKAVVWYASRDNWWSCFRLKSPPGSYIRIVRGSPNGPFDGIYPSIPGYDFDKKRQEFVPNGEDRRTFLSNLGVVYVGWNRYIYRRAPRYNVIRKDEEGAEIVRPAHRDDGYALFQHTIGFKETFIAKDRWPCPAVVEFAVQIIFPVQAEFIVGTWETQIENGIRQILREWFGTHDIDEIKVERDAGGNDLVDIVLKTSFQQGGMQERGFLSLIGVFVRSFRFVDLDLETGDPKVAEALQEVARATERARAKVALATGDRDAGKLEAERIETLGAAEARRLELLREKGGEVGLQLAATEAFSRGIAGANVVSVGSANLGIITESSREKKTPKDDAP